MANSFVFFLCYVYNFMGLKAEFKGKKKTKCGITKFGILYTNTLTVLKNLDLGEIKVHFCREP